MSKIFAINGVKILGRAIGSAKPDKPSEVDGDGDGFLTGLDGRDNVPAPKAVVDAARKAGRVADILKPTDDLMEVRKSGRPWKPLLLEHQPKEWLDEYQKLARETRDRMIARGKKRAEIEAEWKKKYGWSGSFALEDMTVVPEAAIEEMKKYWGEYLDHRTDGDAAFLKRMSDLDEQFKDNIRNKFKEQESKAIQEGKGEMLIGVLLVVNISVRALTSLRWLPRTLKTLCQTPTSVLLFTQTLKCLSLFWKTKR